MYPWSRNKGLLALIYDEERMKEEFPTFPPYANPESPPNTPSYDDDADKYERREACAVLNI